MRFGSIGGIVLGGLVALACAPPAADKDLVVQKDGTSAGNTNGSGSRAMEGQETTELGRPTEDTSEQVLSPEESTTDGGVTTTPEKSEPECKGWWCPSTSNTKSVSCNSEAEGNKNESVVKYSDENGTIKILSISAFVTNKNHRNLNDAKVYVKASAIEHTYVLKIDTGDTLPDAKTVMMQVPADLTFQAGGRLRIDTNFDDSFGDPMGRCEVQF